MKPYRPKILFEKKWPELLAVLLHAMLFILGGLLMARWSWHFFAPITQELPPKLEQTTSSQLTHVLAAHWFTPATGQIVIAAQPVNFKLVGIYASTSSKPGFAVFKLADGKQRAVLLHEEISPGIVLLDIKPEVVEVGQQGNTQKLYLGNRKPSNNSPLVNTPVLKKV